MAEGLDDSVALERATHWWWILLAVAVAQCVIFVALLVSIGDTFFAPFMAPGFLIAALGLAFNAGFEFNNRLRAQGRTRGGPADIFRTFDRGPIDPT